MKSYEELKGDAGFKPVKLNESQAKNDLARKFRLIFAASPHKLTCSSSVLPFSSGTTGKGKGVMLSAFNVTSCVQQTIQTKDLFDQKDVM